MFFKKRFCVFGLLTLLFLSGSFFALQKTILAQTENNGADGTGKILISEIKTRGEQTGDEFIELYNPNGYVVDVSGWSLKKKTKMGVTEYNLLSDMGTKVDPLTGHRDDSGVGLEIAPGGYFLIAPRFVCGVGENEKCYLGATEPDNFYSVKEFIADDNSLALYDGEKVLSDQIGWGQVSASVGDIFAENIPAGKSLARRIVAGEMQNTGDISRDFFVQDLPDSRNYKSGAQASGGEVVGGGESDAGDIGEEIGGTETEMETETETEAEAEIETEDADESSNDNVPGEVLPTPTPSAGASASSPSAVSTVEKKIIISEILISPAGDDTKVEFIEIYNAGTGIADIGGWSLEDQLGTISKYIFPVGMKIKSGEYQSFYSAQTKISLNNTADGAVLKDETGKLISKTPLSGEAKEGISFALENDNWSWTSVPTPGSKNIIKAQETAEKQIQTPIQTPEPEVVESETAAQEAENTEDVEPGGGEEVVGSGEDYDFSDGVIINEIFPDPVGRDNQENNFEWVELFNENDRSVNLKGWCLDDILEKGSKMFCFANDRMIAARGFLVVSSSETKIAFNNTEEEVNLLWPDKRVIDSVSYQKAQEGYSYSLSASGTWGWVNKATPSAVNAKLASTVNKAQSATKKTAASTVKYPSVGSVAKSTEESGTVLPAATLTEEQYVVATIAQAKALPSGSAVQLSGLVSAPRGILGQDILYLSEKDSGEGVQVFGAGDDLSELLLGDEVTVSGKISEVGGEKRLMADEGTAAKISGDNLLESFVLDFANLESGLGGLVTVEGEVSSLVDDKTFLLKASGGEIKIYAEPETGISFADIKSGNRVAITGIFSRTSLGYRLLPRFESDIRFLESADGGIISASEGGPVKGSDFSLYLELAFWVAIPIIISWWYFNRAGKNKLA